MKYICAAALSALGLLMTGSAHAQQLTEAQAKQVIARVGDEVITAGEYARELEFRLRRLQASTGQNVEPDLRFRRAVLSELVNSKVLSVAARNHNVEVSDEELEKEFSERKAAFPSETAYQEYLEQAGLSEDEVRETVRARLRVERFVDEKVGELTASEEEIQQTYNTLEAQGVMNRTETTRDIAAILIRVDGDSDEAWRAAEERARAVYDRLKAGEEFQTVAREVSEDEESANRGGVFKEMKPGSFFPEIESAMASMEPGAVSEPIRSVLGWYLVTILAVNEPGVIPLESVREGLEQEVIGNKRKEKVAEIIQEEQKLLRIELTEGTASAPDTAPAVENDTDAEGEEDAPAP